VKVLGTVAQAREALPAVEPEELAIAIPSASPSTLRRILDELEPLNLPVKVLPGIRQVMEGEVGVGYLRPLRIEDLLGREPVELRIPALEADLRGRTVLVTGAAGSIGSELARQIAINAPARLVLLDQAESDLYFVDVE
jgi:FlaA1/EpsC-like NDP-sugar epimerase